MLKSSWHIWETCCNCCRRQTNLILKLNGKNNRRTSFVWYLLCWEKPSAEFMHTVNTKNIMSWRQNKVYLFRTVWLYNSCCYNSLFLIGPTLSEKHLCEHEWFSASKTKNRSKISTDFGMNLPTLRFLSFHVGLFSSNLETHKFLHQLLSHSRKKKKKRIKPKKWMSSAAHECCLSWLFYFSTQA